MSFDFSLTPKGEKLEPSLQLILHLLWRLLYVRISSSLSVLVLHFACLIAFCFGFFLFLFPLHFCSSIFRQTSGGASRKTSMASAKTSFFHTEGHNSGISSKHNAKIWFFGPSFSRVTLWPWDKHLLFIHNGTPRYFHLWIYAKILRILPTFV